MIGINILAYHVKLVDRALCETYLANEQLFEVEADHGTICFPTPRTEVYRQVESLIHETVQKPMRSPTQVNEEQTRQTQDQGFDAISLEEASLGQWVSLCAIMFTLTFIDPEPHTIRREPVEFIKNSSYERLPSIPDFQPPRRKPKLPCHKLNSLISSPEFLGRDDILSSIDKALLPSDHHLSEMGSGNLQSFALCGLGGVGKT